MTTYAPDRTSMLAAASKAFAQAPMSATFNADVVKCECGKYKESRTIFSHDRNHVECKHIITVVNCEECWLELQPLFEEVIL